MRGSLLAFVFVMFSAYVSVSNAQEGRPNAEPTEALALLTPDAIKWQPLPRQWADGPPPLAQGETNNATEVAILQGDPTKEGSPFVFRIRAAAGTKVPPHFHLIDENITVLSGVFCVGMGDKFDEKACKDMPAGSYFSFPKGMHHFALAKGDVIQIHGIGPFKIYWVR